MTIWKNVENELPDTCRRVLAAEKHGYIAVCQYVPVTKSFIECDKRREVVIWAELPLLPDKKAC